jgi:hypothetical protein
MNMEQGISPYTSASAILNTVVGMYESSIEIKPRKIFLKLDLNINFSFSNFENFLITPLLYMGRGRLSCQNGVVYYLPEWKISFPPNFKGYRTAGCGHEFECHIY